MHLWPSTLKQKPVYTPRPEATKVLSLICSVLFSLSAVSLPTRTQLSENQARAYALDGRPLCKTVKFQAPGGVWFWGSGFRVQGIYR